MAQIKEGRLTIEALQRAGMLVIPSRRVIPKQFLAKRVPSLVDIQRRLAKFKGSLAEEIIRIRDTE